MAESSTPTDGGTPAESPAPQAAAAHDHHDGEAIHMPPNSYWPLLTSLGVAVTMVGIVALSNAPFVLPIGIVVLLVGVALWVRDARKEYQGLH